MVPPFIFNQTNKMKKLTKNLSVLLMVLTCGMMLSCGSDDDSYNLDDEEAITLLQGNWNVSITETDDEESETDNYEWQISGNQIKEISSSGGSYTVNFTVSDGNLKLSNYETYKITKLTTKEFRCYANEHSTEIIIVGKR